MVLLHSNTNKAEKEAVEPVLAQLDELEKRIASRFARLEAKEAALAYIKGLISPVERKNSWQLTEAIPRTFLPIYSLLKHPLMSEGVFCIWGTCCKRQRPQCYQCCN